MRNDNKKSIFAVATVMNISAKFQLFPHIASEYLCAHFASFCESNSDVWTKIICFSEDYSLDIPLKLLSRSLQ